MKHSYRDARGRFATIPPPAPPPPPRRATPPQWVNGRFVGRDKGRELDARQTEFTGRDATVQFVYPNAHEAAQAAQVLIDGGEYLSRAYTRLTVRPVGDGWVLRVAYRYPEGRQVSP